jgi:hypothetical protein
MHFQASLYYDIVDHYLQSNERNITNTITSITDLLAEEWKTNAYYNGAYVPGAYLYQKKFILLANFVSKTIPDISSGEWVSSGKDGNE